MPPKLFKCKMTVCGESGISKTCLINRILFNDFVNTQSTSGASSSSRDFKLNNDVTIMFDIWDTAGQQMMRSLTKLFYVDTDIIILVYDITNRKSFDEMQNYWIKTVNENCKKNQVRNISIFIYKCSNCNCRNKS